MLKDMDQMEMELSIVNNSDNQQVFNNINWKYRFPGWSKWDDKALPIVRQFISVHRSIMGSDIDELMLILQNNELGWIRKEGIVKKIEELTGMKVGSQADTSTEYGMSIEKNIVRCAKL